MSQSQETKGTKSIEDKKTNTTISFEWWDNLT